MKKSMNLVLFIVCICFMPLLCSESSLADIDNGLVAYFPFNGNALDESGRGNDGTVYGAMLTTDRFDNPNEAYEFDGSNDYIYIGDKNDLKQNYITISAWVQSTASNLFMMVLRYRYHGYGIMLNKGTSLETEDTWLGKFRFILHPSSMCNETDYYDISTSTGVFYNDGKWHHVVLAYDGNYFRTYVDNTVIGEDNSFGNNTICYENGGFAIGRDGNNSALYFKGKIDDIRIYNRALDNTEIQELYQDKLYTLSVNSGTGSGSYPAGQIVNITADEPPVGKIFDKWAGDTAYVEDIDSSITTVIMPMANVTINATYKNQMDQLAFPGVFMLLLEE